MDEDRKRRLIKDYGEALQPFEEVVALLDDGAVDARPAPNAWSQREIIHHVADTEAVAAGRLRLMLARDRAPITTYDEEELNRASNPSARSVEPSLKTIRVLHQANLELLQGIGDEAWMRQGEHEKDGPYDLATWVRRRVEHLRLHSDQLRDGLPR